MDRLAPKRWATSRRHGTRKSPSGWGRAAGPQVTARSSAVTAAPTTITTANGARSHAAIAAAPTPTARAVDHEVVADGERLHEDEGRQQRSRQQGQAPLEPARQRPAAEHHEAEDLEAVGAAGQRQEQRPAHGGPASGHPSGLVGRRNRRGG